MMGKGVTFFHLCHPVSVVESSGAILHFLVSTGGTQHVSHLQDIRLHPERPLKTTAHESPLAEVGARTTRRSLYAFRNCYGSESYRNGRNGHVAAFDIGHLHRLRPHADGN